MAKDNKGIIGTINAYVGIEDYSDPVCGNYIESEATKQEEMNASQLSF